MHKNVQCFEVKLLMSDKDKQIFCSIIAFILLLALPLMGEFYHRTLWYIGVVLLIPKIAYDIMWGEEKFYKRWDKARKLGFKINVARESAKSMVCIVVTVIIGQFFGNDLTPLYIVDKLISRDLIGLFLFIVALGIGSGVAAWFGNEKKYCRMHFDR